MIFDSPEEYKKREKTEYGAKLENQILRPRM